MITSGCDGSGRLGGGGSSGAAAEGWSGRVAGLPYASLPPPCVAAAARDVFCLAITRYLR